MIDSRCGDDSSDFDPPEHPARYPEQAACKICNETKLSEDMVSRWPGSGWNICDLCESRLHPICACGCGRLARIIADVRWPGGVDCRAPWVDVEHARASVAEHLPYRPAIDVLLDAHDLPALLALAPTLSPCWCDIENMTCDHGYKYRTRLPWCPTHGNKE